MKIVLLTKLGALLPALFVFLPHLVVGAPQRPLLVGGDVSEIPEVEAAGGQFFEGSKQEDPFAIMQHAGWNLVRFRVWNKPRDGFCDKAHTLELARRAKAHGLKISLDFHYSDWWADPGKQNKPAAWRELSFEALTKAVHDYTKDVVSAMVAQGTPPVMVQVGNEIVGGMLWPDGRVDSDDPAQWKKLAALLNAGIRGVRDAQGSNHILTMIHLDRGGDAKTAVWWFDHITDQGVPFDLIGLSYYPFWHGTIENLRSCLGALAKYRRDIYVVETGYPWSLDVAGRGGARVFADKSKLLPGFPATAEGQAQFLKAVLDAIRQAPGGHGKGLLYWAPTWISASKQRSPYDNLALFDYDGKALSAVGELGKARR